MVLGIFVALNIDLAEINRDIEKDLAISHTAAYKDLFDGTGPSTEYDGHQDSDAPNFYFDFDLNTVDTPTEIPYADEYE